MAILILPPSELLAIVRDLVATLADAGKPVLPADRRAEVVHTLMSALIGPAAGDEYCLALEDEFARSGVGQPPDASLAGLPVEILLRDGLGALSDDQLACLAVSPAAIRALNKRVEQAMQAGTVGDLWWEVCDSVANQLPPTYLGADAIHRTADFIRELERDNPEESHLITVPVQPAPARPRFGPTLRWGAGLFAMAASLLVAFFLGGYVLRNGGGRDDGNQVLLASATPKYGTVRGTERDLRVEMRSGLTGFATVVALVPGQRPEELVFPGIGGDDIPVEASTPIEFGPLPSATTSVLFVVTETPAAERARKALRGKAFASDQIDELQTFLREALQAKGYRRMAFGSAQFDPPTKK